MRACDRQGARRRSVRPIAPTPRRGESPSATPPILSAESLPHARVTSVDVSEAHPGAGILNTNPDVAACVQFVSGGPQCDQVLQVHAQRAAIHCREELQRNQGAASQQGPRRGPPVVPPRDVLQPDQGGVPATHWASITAFIQSTLRPKSRATVRIARFKPGGNGVARSRRRSPLAVRDARAITSTSLVPRRTMPRRFRVAPPTTTMATCSPSAARSSPTA
jgi:hypothetical protein